MGAHVIQFGQVFQDIAHVYVVTCKATEQRLPSLRTSHKASVFKDAELIPITERPNDNRQLSWPDKKSDKLWYTTHNPQSRNVRDCFLGHQAALKAAIDKGAAPFLIIEDSVQLNPTLVDGEVVCQGLRPVTQSLGHMRDQPSGRTYCGSAILVGSVADAHTLHELIRSTNPTLSDFFYFQVGKVTCAHMPLLARSDCATSLGK